MNKEEITRNRELLSTFANVDFQRARFWCLAAAVALDVPRRLGQDASPKELTIDRRVSRKISYTYHSLWSEFSKRMDAPAPPPWEERPVIVNDAIMVRIGTTVIWDRQVDYLINVVNRRLDKFAELHQTAFLDGMGRWYNRHTKSLDNEFNALQRVRDFIDEKQGPAIKQALAT